VMSKVKANNSLASNDRLVNKLQNEIKHLRDVLNLRKKGRQQDMQAQLVSLKLENQRLRDGNQVNNHSLFSQDDVSKRNFILNSPESYYGSKNRYDFSTDMSPDIKNPLFRSEYNDLTQRKSTEGSVSLFQSKLQTKIGNGFKKLKENKSTDLRIILGVLNQPHTERNGVQSNNGKIKDS